MAPERLCSALYLSADPVLYDPELLLFQTLEIFLGSRYDLTGLDLLIALIQLLDDAIIKLLTAFLRYDAGGTNSR